MKYLEREQTFTRGERNRRFRSYLYNSILQHHDNKFSKFVSIGNRSTDEKPITIDMLSKSLFACFLYNQPIEDDLATEAYRRESEIENNVKLMNNLYDLALSGYNPWQALRTAINAGWPVCSDRRRSWHGPNLRATPFAENLTSRMQTNGRGPYTVP